MPRVPREYAAQVAEGLGVDPAMVAVPLIAVLGGISGTKVRLNMDPAAAKPWVIRPIFWAAVVANSGSTKSPAWEAADDLAQIVERALRTENELSWNAYEDSLQAWKEAEGDQRGPKPTPPLMKRLVVDDTTVEGIAGILEDNPSGLLLSTDELRNWVDTFARYRKTGGGSDASRWLPFYSGKRHVVDRKGKDGGRNSLYIPHAAVSVAGTIQPGILSRIVGDEERDSGWLARLLFAMPPARPRSWKPSKGGRKNDARVSAEDLALKLHRMPEAEVLLEPKAVQRFMAWQHRWAMDSFLMENPGLVALRTKLEEVSLRLALLYFTCDHAWEPTMPPAVPLEYMDAGIVQAEWFHREALRVYQSMIRSGEATERYQRIVLWAVDKCAPGAPLEKGFTARDLMRSRLVGDAAEAAQVIEQMWDAKLIAHVPLSGKKVTGRPAHPRFLPAVTLNSDRSGSDDSTDEQEDT
jgi:hypothetical protein